MKKMKSKINPRKIPATQSDVDKAFQKGINEGVKHSIAIFLTVLLDKFDATQDDLKQVWKHIINLSDSVEKGYVKVSDLEKVLNEEYEIEIK